MIDTVRTLISLTGDTLFIEVLVRIKTLTLYQLTKNRGFNDWKSVDRKLCRISNLNCLEDGKLEVIKLGGFFVVVKKE